MLLGLLLLAIKDDFELVWTLHKVQIFRHLVKLVKVSLICFVNGLGNLFFNIVKTLSFVCCFTDVMLSFELQEFQALDESLVLLAHLCYCAKLVLLEQMIECLLLPLSKVSAVNKLVVNSIHFSGIQRLKQIRYLVEFVISVFLEVFVQVVKKV